MHAARHGWRAGWLVLAQRRQNQQLPQPASDAESLAANASDSADRDGLFKPAQPLVVIKRRRCRNAGPPGTNYAVMKKAFEEGWGGVIAKTVSLDSSKVGVVDFAPASSGGANGGKVRAHWGAVEVVAGFRRWLSIA